MNAGWIYAVYAHHKDGTRTVLCAYIRKEDAVRHVGAVSRQAMHYLGIESLAIESIGLHGRFPQELLPDEPVYDRFAETNTDAERDAHDKVQ